MGDGRERGANTKGQIGFGRGISPGSRRDPSLSPSLLVEFNQIQFLVCNKDLRA